MRHLFVILALLLPLGAIGQSSPSGTMGPTRNFGPLVPGNVYSVMIWDARCDGVTDDKTALLEAFNAAAAAGARLTGNNQWCASSAELLLPNALDLEDIKLKNLTPSCNGGQCKFLHYEQNGGSVKLRRVVVDRNGSPSDANVVTQEAAISLRGCALGDTDCAAIPTLWTGKFQLEDVEVYGDGRGTGIEIFFATAPLLVRPYVHDMRWSATNNPCTEQIVGIRYALVKGGRIASPRINRLLASITHPNTGCADGNTAPSNTYVAYNTDGIDCSGCLGVTITDGFISLVHEGVDVSSTYENRGIWLFGMEYEDIGTAAEKWCHDVHHSGSHGSTATRVGFAGLLVCDGRSPDVTGPRHNRWYGFTAIDAGAIPLWTANSQIAGISSPDSGAGAGGAPLDNICIGCSAIDTQFPPKMVYGFNNHSAEAARFTLIFPVASGAATADFFGFPNGSIIINGEYRRH